MTFGLRGFSIGAGPPPTCFGPFMSTSLSDESGSSVVLLRGCADAEGPAAAEPLVTAAGSDGIDLDREGRPSSGPSPTSWPLLRRATTRPSLFSSSLVARLRAALCMIVSNQGCLVAAWLTTWIRAGDCWFSCLTGGHWNVLRYCSLAVLWLQLEGEDDWAGEPDHRQSSLALILQGRKLEKPSLGVRRAWHVVSLPALPSSSAFPWAASFYCPKLSAPQIDPPRVRLRDMLSDQSSR